LLGKGIAVLRGFFGGCLGSLGHVYDVEEDGMPVPYGGLSILGCRIA